MPDETKPEGGASADTPGVPAPAASGPPAAPPKPAVAKPAAPPKAPAAPVVMQTTPWEDDLTRELAEAFAGEITAYLTYLGQSFLVVQPASAIPVLEYLKYECGFDYLVDVTAVHYPKREATQFDLVYVPYSFERNTRIRIKTFLKDGEKAASAVGVHVTADWLEREVFDMFGIEFTGHPGLKRILMPEDWSGHPLRKDYGILQMDTRWVQENLGIESGQ